MTARRCAKALAGGIRSFCQTGDLPHCLAGQACASNFSVCCCSVPLTFPQHPCSHHRQIPSLSQSIQDPEICVHVPLRPIPKLQPQNVHGPVQSIQPSCSDGSFRGPFAGMGLKRGRHNSTSAGFIAYSGLVAVSFAILCPGREYNMLVGCLLTALSPGPVRLETVSSRELRFL